MRGEIDPSHPREHALSGASDFCVCRVLVGCALVTIKSFDKLSTAKKYMQRIAARGPGSYVIFSKANRQILAKN
jgi:hypothetical protein